MLSPSNDDENARRKTIQNESAKLSAAYLNGLAIACVAVGGFNGIFSSDFSRMGTVDLAIFGLRLLLCLGVSGALHWTASNLLRSLR